jgi:hypothetical protein
VGGTEDSSLFSFWREEPLGFSIFSRAEVQDLFLASRQSVSCRRTLISFSRQTICSFSRAVVKALFLMGSFYGLSFAGS